MSEVEPTKTSMTTEKIAGIVTVVFIAVIGIAIVVGVQNSRSSGNNTTTERAPAASDSNDKVITQTVAENYCQDAALLDKYLDNDVSVIDALNYNDQFSELGDSEYSLQWNGKDADSSLLFVCDISGTADDITLNSLAIDGVEVYSR